MRDRLLSISKAKIVDNDSCVNDFLLNHCFHLKEIAELLKVFLKSYFINVKYRSLIFLRFYSEEKYNLNIYTHTLQYD